MRLIDTLNAALGLPTNTALKLADTHCHFTGKKAKELLSFEPKV